MNWSAAHRSKLAAALPQLLQADVPEQAPPECRPMSWEAVRSLAAAGHARK